MKQSIAQQRRERERRELRQAILDAACAIAAQDGWQAVTIRKVAERVEYSPGSIYSYFDSKEAMLETLVKEGFDRLAAQLQAALPTNADAETQLLTLCASYWDFAWRFPELYQVMHSLGGAPFSFPDNPFKEWEAFRLSYELFDRWLQEHELPSTDGMEKVEAIWGLLHGLISLAFTQRLREDRQQAKALALRTVQALLWSWSHAPAER
ncbi:TetR family transcriptional regulator [Thermosporothrix hazakensis]|jgi:AcrR family transcriptional regulator|uniref:TetR family transcriptional regulator n=1 Tax=Thermosporothrix hazakensis TaxID=644383 RepID=A0A326UAM7_THEHA|nr:TetR/AcrR family transcriptional regulator [Thermosporothrix hazakensis]PZW32629.1 TetR family transcriptional regulator [Thermosporothrix hazakensis]GCE49982.1 TetR family transcriptional regulator [Thermosporothrix hazakensis]